MDYKRLPYGVADYTWIKSQNRYCADKTMFIPKMEEAGDFLYLIRPRRFATVPQKTANLEAEQMLVCTPGVCWDGGK